MIKINLSNFRVIMLCHRPTIMVFLYKRLDSKSMLSFALIDWRERRETPAGKATAEDPAGSGFLPRRLKRCPRKANAWSGNQQSRLTKPYEKTPLRIVTVNDGLRDVCRWLFLFNVSRRQRLNISVRLVEQLQHFLILLVVFVLRVVQLILNMLSIT